MNLNYLIPLIGAIIPSIIQAKKSSTLENLDEDTLGRFTLNFIYAIIVLVASCMTIHAEILNKSILLGEFNANHSSSNFFSITLIHYIVMIGLGLPFLILVCFNSFIDGCSIRTLTFKKIIVYFLIIAILLAIGLNILFVEPIFNIN